MKLRSLVCVAMAFAAARAVGEEPVRFETHVRPILKRHCVPCHGEEEKPKAELDQRLLRWIVKEGESGAGDELFTPRFNNLSPDDADKRTATGFLRMAPDGTTTQYQFQVKRIL